MPPPSPAPDAGPAPRETWFWTAGLLAGAVVALAWAGLAGRVPPADPAAAAARFVVEVRAEVHPEPADFARYALVVFGLPLAWIAAYAALRRLDAPARLGPWLQALVVAAFVDNWIDQPFFGTAALSFGGLAVGALLAGHRRIAGWWTRPTASRLPDALAAALAAWWLLPALETDVSLPMAARVVSFHLPYQVGEFAAPLAGNYPLVGFLPQYVHVLPLLALPWFSALGLGVGTFTGLMVALSFAGLLCTYGALKRLFSGQALVPFALVLGMAGFHAAPLAGHWTYLFNYYALAPMRLFGPQVLLLLVAGVAATGRGERALALVAGVVAVNNLDCGAPALIAAAAAVAVRHLHGTPPSTWGRPLLRVALTFAAGLAVAAIGFALAVRLLAGAWPDPTRGLVFQQIFAQAGFFMAPMPAGGLHTIVLATHLGAVTLVAIDLCFGLGPRGPLLPRANATVLAFCGIFGAGTFAYYVGRSLNEVLASQFPTWALTVVVLAGTLLRVLPVPAPRAWLRHAAALPLLVVLAAMVAPALALPAVPEQLARLGAASARRPPYAARVAARAAFVRAHAPAGAPTVVLAADSHWIAHEAGVRNVFAFNHGDSVITYAQNDLVLADLARAGVAHVFGAPRAELAVRLGAAGFVPGAALDDFVHWERR